MRFHDLLRGQLALSELNSSLLAASRPRRGKTLELRRMALLCALGGAVILFGCNSYNPNLGAPPTQTSGLSFLTPGAKPAGSGGFSLGVNGAGFVTGSTVMWNNGTQATALVTTLANVSGTQLNATVPATLIAQPGTFTIDVTSPPLAGTTAASNLGNNVSNYVSFCVNPPVATITTISPAAVAATCAAFTLTVNGTGFLAQAPANSFSGTAVFWNNSQRLTTFVSSTQVTAQITAADIAAAGTAPVTIVLDPGACQTPPSNSQTFQINAAAPAVTKAASSAVATLTGQTSVKFAPAITSGPRFAAFVAVSADPATDAGLGVNQIFLRDTCIGAAAGCTPQTSAISAGLSGAAPDADSRAPSISADGRFVAFASDADNLVTGDSNGVADIFLRDTCFGASAGCTPSTVRVSVAADGTQANAASDSPSISADGRFVAFDSAASNLTTAGGVPVAGTSSAAIFVRDTCFGAANSCTATTTPLATSTTH